DIDIDQADVANDTSHDGTKQAERSIRAVDRQVLDDVAAAVKGSDEGGAGDRAERRESHAFHVNVAAETISSGQGGRAVTDGLQLRGCGDDPARPGFRLCCSLRRNCGDGNTYSKQRKSKSHCTTP